MDSDDFAGCLSSQGSQNNVGTIECDAGYHYDDQVFLETTVTEVRPYKHPFTDKITRVSHSTN